MLTFWFDSENDDGTLLILGNIRSLDWNWFNGWSGYGWGALWCELHFLNWTLFGIDQFKSYESDFSEIQWQYI